MRLIKELDYYNLSNRDYPKTKVITIPYDLTIRGFMKINWDFNNKSSVIRYRFI